MRTCYRSGTGLERLPDLCKTQELQRVRVRPGPHSLSFSGVSEGASTTSGSATVNIMFQWLHLAGDGDDGIFSLIISVLCPEARRARIYWGSQHSPRPGPRELSWPGMGPEPFPAALAQPRRRSWTLCLCASREAQSLLGCPVLTL